VAVKEAKQMKLLNEITIDNKYECILGDKRLFFDLLVKLN